MAKVTLKAGGKREKVSTEKAQAAVNRWKVEAKGNQVVGIDISCLSWTQAAFAIIKAFLVEVAGTIKYANLADIIASLDTDEGLAVIEQVVEVFQNSPLVDLDLSDNALGLRGMERIKPLLAGKPLQRLYLSNNGLSAESMVHLRECVEAQDITMGRSLQVLVLDRNCNGTGGAEEAGKILPMCNLKYFSYLGCRIQKGTLALAKGLQKMAENNTNPALVRLDIDDGNFGEEEEPAYVPLAGALKLCRGLQRLNLTDAKLEIEGLELLLGALTAAGVSLTHLGLESCGELGAAGAEVLAKFLDTNSQATTLQTFNCATNELGDEGLPILLEPFATTNCSLKELNLSCNELETESAKALLQYVFPSLQKLNLSDNMDIPKKYLKEKYGDVVVFDDDEDDDEEDEDVQDDMMDALVDQFKTTKI